MAVKRKSFDDWTAQSVRDTFQIQQVAATPLLQAWLSAVHAPNLQETAFLESKRVLLEQFYRTWNEDELKFRFIAQVVELASLIGVGYNTFTQRVLSATVHGVLLHGRPELMVASGREEPKKPYFFIHEYKPSRKSEDPLGQLLAAMLAAQTHNADGEPLLGCFVIGAIWQFLILDGQNYTLSRPYDAVQTSDLLNIYSALCQSKVYVEARL
ncbi:MAG: hypothetical protein RLZZ628_840 [Bacteroidota bacterium]|jgi:hypothetical protein